MYIVILSIFIAASFTSGNEVHPRFKRQLPFCANGRQAVAGCFRPQLRCNGIYTCETTTGLALCCPPATPTTNPMPTCPSGISASAGCIRGGCNLGFRCFNSQLCCGVCPNNATNVGTCTSTSTTCAGNTQCTLFGTTGLCCPPSTTGPTTPPPTTPPPTTPPTACPGGAEPAGGCINGQCFPPLQCIANTLCCN